MKKYVVRLTEGERERLGSLTRKGKAAAYKIRHASILLKADANRAVWSDERIAEAVGCHVRTVENVRRRSQKIQSNTREENRHYQEDATEETT